MKVLENVGVGTELGKRTYLDGVVLTKVCDCGEVIKIDLGAQCLIYHTVGDISTVYLHCDKCGKQDQPMNIVLSINLTVLD